MTSINGTTSAASIQFKDVPTKESHWAYDTIQWAVEKGVTKGYQDGTFKPNNYITEAEFLAILLGIYSNVKLTDLNTGHWANKFYEHAHKFELPLSDNRNQPITRGYVARLISATFGYNYNQNRAIEYLFEMGLSSGKTGKKTIEDYEPNNKLTRAEAVQFLRNLNDKNSGSPKFIGLKPIEGQYADTLRKIQNTVHEKGFDIDFNTQTGNFSIKREYQNDNKKTTQTVISYSSATSDNDYSYLFINKAEPNIITLSHQLLTLMGVPVNQSFINDVTLVSSSGNSTKKKYGEHTTELSWNKATESVTVRYKIFK